MKGRRVAPKILFVDNSTKLYSTEDLKTKARGGMVTSLFRVSDFLQNQGCNVHVLSDITVTGYSEAGVEWLDEPQGSYDCLIMNRGVGNGFDQVEAKARILWTHDLPHAGFIPNPKTIRAFDCVVCMSAYAEKIWKSFFATIDTTITIPNGVDRDLFYFEPLKKATNYLIYASAPNRGVQKLPFIVDGIQAAIKNMQLYCDAYSNMSTLHPGEEDYAIDYKEFKDSLVELHDPIPQSEFAPKLREAGLMILPSNYPEICSNTVLQSLACGTPIITTGQLGFINEYIKHGRNGMLTKWQPHDYMIYWLEIIRNAVDVLQDEKRHRRIMKRASKTKILSWEEVGWHWLHLINHVI